MGISFDLIVGDRNVTDFECTICLELIEDEIVLKGCLHRFCRICIENVIRQDKRKCPDKSLKCSAKKRPKIQIVPKTQVLGVDAIY